MKSVPGKDGDPNSLGTDFMSVPGRDGDPNPLGTDLKSVPTPTASGNFFQGSFQGLAMFVRERRVT